MSRPLCLVVGGSGGLMAEYRRAVEDAGYDLDYYEQAVPRGTHAARQRSNAPPRVNRIGAVVVFACRCSHPQRKAAAGIAKDLGLTVHYLRSAAPTALRRALMPQEVAGAGR